MKIYRPLWEGGAFLSPQQLQQQSEWASFSRVSNGRMADLAVTDVSLFWLLSALNTRACVPSEFEYLPAHNPERICTQLTHLAGSILTFSLNHDLDVIPGYDHQIPENTFPRLFELISQLLKSSGSNQRQSVRSGI